MIFPLVGNEKTASTVTNFIKEKRIPHAILILGDSGTGKHTLAHFLAKAIVCGESEAPCSMCDNCRLAENRNHPDINIIAPDEDRKNIVKEQIDKLRNEAFIKPHKSFKRVFLIDKADTLNTVSQNKLLKILEEPPEAVMFLLVAENKAAFLDTVISRCVVLNLAVPEFSKAFQYLKNKTKYGDGEIGEALKTSQNNIGNALILLKGKGMTKVEAAASDFLNFLYKNDQYNMLLTLNAFAKKRVEVDIFLKALKNEVAKKIKNDPKSHFAKPLMMFYNEIFDYEQALFTNVNLNLFFSNIVCSATKIFWRNK